MKWYASSKRWLINWNSVLEMIEGGHSIGSMSQACGIPPVTMRRMIIEEMLNPTGAAYSSPEQAEKIKTMLESNSRPKSRSRNPELENSVVMAQLQQEHFGPGENPANFGVPQVELVGNIPSSLNIPGVDGAVNITVSLQAIKTAMESAFGGDFFAPITTIKVEDMPGRFGEAHSHEPHTIYLSINSMKQAIVDAAGQQANQAAAQGQTIKPNLEIEQRINREIARLLWETTAHERQHDIDFQFLWQKIMKTNQGNFSSVQESAGENAGKSSLSRFDWP